MKRIYLVFSISVCILTQAVFGGAVHARHNKFEQYKLAIQAGTVSGSCIYTAYHEPWAYYWNIDGESAFEGSRVSRFNVAVTAMDAMGYGYKMNAANTFNMGIYLGFIKGDGDGNFRPLDYITEYEAVAVFVRALGYEEDALENGGYPDGYLKIARDIGLLKGTDIPIGDNDNELINGEAYLLKLSSMRIPIKGRGDICFWDTWYDITNKYDAVIEDIYEVRDYYPDGTPSDYTYKIIKFNINGEVKEYEWFYDTDISDMIGEKVTVWTDEIGNFGSGYPRVIDMYQTGGEGSVYFLPKKVYEDGYVPLMPRSYTSTID